MTSYTKLIEAIKSANWLGANQIFRDIMEQKVADRLVIEKATIFTEDDQKSKTPRTVKCMLTRTCGKSFKTTEAEPSCKYCGTGYENIED